MSISRLKTNAGAQDAVQQVLSHIKTRVRNTRSEAPYDGLIVVPELPMTRLTELGSLHRLDNSSGADALPSLLLETRTGQTQIEVCPFGPLALLTSDGEADTDPIALALLDAEIWPVFQNDLDNAGRWHGTPLAHWLFPRRLADALALFDGLCGGSAQVTRAPTGPASGGS